MNPERWQKIQQLFDHALDLPAGDRKQFLAAECGEDSTLLRQVHSLLAVDVGSGGTLESAVSAAVVDAAHSGVAIGQSIGPYRLVREIGEGGMGVVYEAEQLNPRRSVALKLIRAGRYASERQRRLFQREGEALGRLKHPAIATIYESGVTADGQAYLAMELVNGEPLSAYLSRVPAPAELRKDSVRERLSLFLAICGGVNYAHQNGVIHRDLKPSNILLPAISSGSGGSTHTQAQVKILDFGLARISEESGGASGQTFTGTGVVQGSVPYMSPEQARGDNARVDTRSDIYALGVILYELLTGKHPYLAGNPGLVEAIQAIATAPPKRLSEVTGARPDADLETIVIKALEKEPERRYASTATFAADIERYLADQPIVARPASTFYQVQKLIQRNRAAFAALVGLVALLIAFSVSVWLQSQRVKAERDRANQEAATARQVSEFLVNLFREANPSQANGVLTARDLLVSGQERLSTELKDQPELKARLLVNIGGAYTVVGPLSEARKAIEESLRLREATFGADSTQVADSWNALSDVFYNEGDYEHSADACRKALEINLKRLGPDANDVLRDRNCLAVSLSAAGRIADAEREISIAVEADRKSNNQTLAAAARLESFGTILRRKGNYRAAAPILRESIERHQKLKGENSTARASNELALAHQRAGEHEQAMEAFARTKRLAARVFGPDHANIAMIGGSVAFSLLKLGRYAEAELETRNALSIGEKAMGPQHPRLADLWFTIGEALQGQKKNPAEADAAMQRGLQMLRAKYKPGDFQMAFALARVGEYEVKAGRAQQALPYLRDALAVLRGKGVPEEGWAYVWEGRARTALGQQEEGRRAMASGRAILAAKLGADHPDLKKLD